MNTPLFASDPTRAGSSWLSRSSWVLLVALLPALHVLGSCVRESDDGDASETTPVTDTADTAAPSTAVPATEAPAGTTVTTAAEPAAMLPPTGNPEFLGDWGQLGIRDGRLVTLDDVTPYTLNSALFSDYAHKLRTVWVPDGASAAIADPESSLDFPVGTVITKTFYFPVADTADDAAIGVLKAPEDPAALADGLDLDEVRLVETRVLVHRDDGWHAFPYVWNDDETEATLERTGDLKQLTLVDVDTGTEAPFPYLVPDVNQCANCHAVNHSSGAIQPIGPKARHLDGDIDLGDGPEPQLAAWIDRGLLGQGDVAVEAATAVDWTDESASLDDRARAYLDINCAHCHNPAGAADTSGLFLEPTTEVGPELGICKNPIAAGSGTGGREYDIVPGDPDASILVYRMDSTEPDEMMPELGRSLAHDEGVDLITEWIASLPGGC